MEKNTPSSFLLRHSKQVSIPVENLELAFVWTVARGRRGATGTIGVLGEISVVNRQELLHALVKFSF